MILFFLGEFEGFENPFVACCGHGGKYNFNRFMKCGAKKNPIDGKEIVISNTCKDPSVGYSTKQLMVHFRTHPFHWKWPVMEWTTKSLATTFSVCVCFFFFFGVKETFFLSHFILERTLHKTGGNILLTWHRVRLNYWAHFRGRLAFKHSSLSLSFHFWLIKLLPFGHVKLE